MKKFVIGIDSVDSLFGGCTTHFTVFLIKNLLLHGYLLMDIPHLVRLNQFIPWKTRGNAAVAIIVGTDQEDRRSAELLDLVVSSIKSYSRDLLSDNAGVAILEIDENGDSTQQEIQSKLYRFYKKTLIDLVTESYLFDLIGNTHILTWGKKGIIGAVSAIGYILTNSVHTYELIAYRRNENVGKRRIINEETVRIIESKNKGKLFNNYNFKEKTLVAAPRGPDPILIGLRGSDPYLLIDSAKEIEFGESPSSWMIFASNQHLDEHSRYMKINEVRIFSSGYIEGVVESRPIIYKKGHVVAKLRDNTGTVHVYFFAPSNPLNKIAMSLRVGDYVGVLGGAKSSGENIVFEAQKLWVYESPPEINLANPSCPVCGHRLKSNGKLGLKCMKCDYRTSMKHKTLMIENYRNLRGVYTPLPGRINHLVEPSWINIDKYNLSYDHSDLLQRLLELE